MPPKKKQEQRLDAQYRRWPFFLNLIIFFFNIVVFFCITGKEVRNYTYLATTSEKLESRQSESESFLEMAAKNLFEVAVNIASKESPPLYTQSFDNLVALKGQYQQQQEQKQKPKPKPRRYFDINNWTATDRTDGGLTDADRILLGKIYRNARSIFEYGLGESTKIASLVNVPRYSGVDSDAVYVASARDNAPDYFRFYFADIGPTKVWGYPEGKKLPKNEYNYQIASLLAEQYPFDVYMVDGRWRVPCVLVSLLHASSQLKKTQQSLPKNSDNIDYNADDGVSGIGNGDDGSDPIILLHDCFQNKELYGGAHKNRKPYSYLESILDMVDHSGKFLCVYKRKPDTTDEMIYDMWLKWKNYVKR